MIKRNLVDTYDESVEIYDEKTGITVGKLTRCIADSGEEEYLLNMYWDEYDKIPQADDIPGYDMDLRSEEYVRHDYTVFMTEYMPPPGRSNARELMLSVGLDMKYDMWAFMVEQGRICLDYWRVKRIEGQVYMHDKYKIKNN